METKCAFGKRSSHSVMMWAVHCQRFSGGLYGVKRFVKLLRSKMQTYSDHVKGKFPAMNRKLQTSSVFSSAVASEVIAKSLETIFFCVCAPPAPRPQQTAECRPRSWDKDPCDILQFDLFSFLTTFARSRSLAVNFKSKKSNIKVVVGIVSLLLVGTEEL